MKYVLFGVIALLLLCVALAACDKTDAQAYPNSRFVAKNYEMVGTDTSSAQLIWSTNYTYVIVDHEEGCQYLVAKDNDGNMTMTLLVDKYGYPLLAAGYERGTRVEMSQDVGD